MRISDWSSDVCSSDLIALADAVGALDAGDAALRADRAIAHLAIHADLIDRRLDIGAVGMAVDEHALARAPAEQLIERHPRRLGLDVPQRGIARGDRGPRHRPAPPIRPATEGLPTIPDPARAPAQPHGAYLVPHD